MMRLKVLVPIGLVLAFLAAACAPAAVAPPAKPGDRTGVTDTSIKVGHHTPLTGPCAGFGIPILRGTQVAIDDVNAAGGVHGRKIEFIIVDDLCEPEKAVAETKRLVEDEKVFLMAPGAASAPAIAVAETLKGTNVPVVIWTSSTFKEVYKNTFVFGPAAFNQGGAIANLAISHLKAKRLASFRESIAHGEGNYQGFVAMAKRQGLELVADEKAPAGATDVSAQILRLKEAKPDAVLLATYQGVGAIFLRQAREMGFQVPFLASGGASVPEILQLAPPEAFATYYGLLFLQDVPGGPRFKEFDEKYFKKFPGDVVPLTGKINMYTYTGAANAYGLVEALKRAGRDLTREGVVTALETFKDWDGGIWSSPISFGPDDHEGVDGMRFYTYKEVGKEQVIDKVFSGVEVMK